MADVIKKVMATPQTKAVTENTEANVKSAIEGPLIFEEKTPEVNLETVEAIDPKTKRYPPRIRLNFKEFPLIKIAASEEDKEPDTFAEINLHQTDLIVSRIRQRIKQDKIDVVFKGRTATLTGSVASQRQMELAETMLRFEPGIDTVENKLTVKP
ncbi:hypothetical protein FACS18942_02470 [Planctomycetales bacterium]|nr:hypothetical protein FACS18942_02470 [Planctomycetales bacterium]GHT36675.1 hypothetical protein FACS189427_08720 [Planctomycetales bacterium]